jgi:AcrR family transcriptional regulator
MENINKKDKKKLLIIKALKDLLANNVYSRISIEDIAREAGLSKGGLRHYFPTKEDLYLELIEDFFNEIQSKNIDVLQGIEFESKDRAFLSTLYGIETFLVDKKNIRIFINIIQYGFEDSKIMSAIRNFLRKHLNLYKDIANDMYKQNNSSNNIDKEFIGRISQIILLFTGLIEFIDPINIETSEVIKHLLKLLDS